MTLAKTWQECLRMWKYVVKNLKRGESGSIVVDLKKAYLKKRGIDRDSVLSTCFFCQYAKEQARSAGEWSTCEYCPGRLVDESFDCQDFYYDYYDRPCTFYRKLLQLDKKRRTNEQSRI
jgi:hypothetical protein